MVKEGDPPGSRHVETRRGQDCLGPERYGHKLRRRTVCRLRDAPDRPVLSVLLRFRPDRTADWPSPFCGRQRNPYAAAGTVIIRRKMDRRNIGIGDKLKPYGLPDAALADIKHTSLSSFCFPLLVTGGITVIPHAHQKLVGGFFVISVISSVKGRYPPVCSPPVPINK